MSWPTTPTGSATGSDSDVSTIDASSSTLNLQAGDLLIVAVGWSGGDTTVSVALTDSSEAFSMQAVTSYSTRNSVAIGHRIIVSAASGVTVRATLGDVRGNVRISVAQIRPDSGDTVSIAAGPSPVSSSSGATSQTGNISPSGDDILVFAGQYNAAGPQPSSQQIADTAADFTLSPGTRSGLWYKVFTASQTDIHAQCTYGDDDSWSIDLLALKSESGGSGSPVPKILQAHGRAA